MSAESLLQSTTLQFGLSNETFEPRFHQSLFSIRFLIPPCSLFFFRRFLLCSSVILGLASQTTVID